MELRPPDVVDVIHRCEREVREALAAHHGVAEALERLSRAETIVLDRAAPYVDAVVLALARRQLELMRTTLSPLETEELFADHVEWLPTEILPTACRNWQPDEYWVASVDADNAAPASVAKRPTQ